MADKESRVDLVLRAAQKMQRRDNRSLAERAAEKLAQMNPAPAPAAPAEAESPPKAANRPAPPPAAARAPAAPATPTARPSPARSPASPPAVEARPKEAPSPAVPPAEPSILTATGRRAPASPPTADTDAAEPVSSIVSSVEAASTEQPSSILTSTGRRAESAPPAKKTVDAVPSPAPAADKSRGAGQRTTIDLMRLHLSGFVTPQSERTRISEEYRVIKRPLLLNAFTRGDHRIPNGHLIMVTSARPGEGKTFTALNLAMSMASERELYVLLIDADVHRASLMDVLDVKAEKGLVDMLVDEKLSLQDTLVHTNVPNLTLLPAGMRHAEATELLASQRMTNLMEDIATRYPDRVIIIDTPPILASSEAGVLGLLVGQVVMVVEWGATTRQAVEQALPLIGTCPNINFVLNKASFYIGSDRFGMYTSDGVYGG